MIRHGCFSRVPDLFVSWPMALMHSAAARARILDGKRAASEWESELQVKAALLTAQLHRPPGLTVLLVGQRPDSLLYVARKQEACQKVGVSMDIVALPEDIRQLDLEAELDRVCRLPDVDGVLVQLPLPRHLDEGSAMERLDPGKDVDGFHPLNMGRMLMRGRQRHLVPCTPLGCLELLSRSGIDVRGKGCVVVGDSNVVGTPLAVMLRDHGAAAVTICHRISYKEWFEDQAGVDATRRAAAACLPRLPGPRSTSDLPGPRSTSGKNTIDGIGRSIEAAPPPAGGSAPSLGLRAHQLPDITRTADLLVVAVGHAELVRADWVKPGAVVVDVGINVVQPPPPLTRTTAVPASAPCNSSEVGVENPGLDASGSAPPPPPPPTSVQWTPGAYQIVGDVAFDEVSQVASAITPVPGGVGPMTISALIHNTLLAAQYRLAGKIAG